MTNKIVPISGLKQMAKSIASIHGDKGAIVISVGDGIARIGTDGLSSAEIRQALCIAIYESINHDIISE